MHIARERTDRQSGRVGTPTSLIRAVARPSFPAIVSLLLASAVLAGTACSDRSIHNGDLIISARPAALPEDFPRELVYPESKVELLGELDTAGFWSPAQYAISLRSQDEADVIRSYYMDFLKQDHWQILQSRHFENEKKTVIVAESPVQRTVTLVIPDGKPSLVQLYLKRSADD